MKLNVKLRKKGLSHSKISSYLKDELGYSVTGRTIGNILNDISWMKKEKTKNELQKSKS